MRRVCFDMTSYNPFDDLPVTSKGMGEKEKVELEENAPKRRKIDNVARAAIATTTCAEQSVGVAECKEEGIEGVKTEDKPQYKKVDVMSTLQTLRKHMYNAK